MSISKPVCEEDVVDFYCNISIYRLFGVESFTDHYKLARMYIYIISSVYNDEKFG